MLRIIVLAAGLSRRMGEENKLLLPFRGKTIVETTIENILAADIGEVFVVVGYEAEQVKSVLKNYPLSIIENFDYENGMTTSIQTGIRAASHFSPQPRRGGSQNPNTKHHTPYTIQGYMICLSDMVLIEPEEYRFLAQQFLHYAYDHAEENVIFQPVFEGKRGNPVIFSPFYKKAILETTDTEGCRSVVQQYKKHLKLVEMPTNHVLQDVDFREDYEKLTSEK